MTLTKKDVHIIPLGWEFDRAVLPFTKPVEGKFPTFRAHVIHLLVPGSQDDRGFSIRVQEALRAVASVERHSVQRYNPATNELLEFDQVLKHTAQICVREIYAGNRVHINLSAASKLAATAAGLAGMAHIRADTGTMYYVEPEHYAMSADEFKSHGLAVGLKRVQEVGLIPLRLPPPIELRILSFLQHQEKPEALLREIVAFLEEVPDSGFQRIDQSLQGTETPQALKAARNAKNNATTKLSRLLGPLKDEKLIEEYESKGSKGARLTKNGHLYAALSAVDQPGLRTPLRPR